MRFFRVFRVLTLLAFAVVAAIWFHERTLATALEARSHAERGQEELLAGMRAECDRLREQLRVEVGKATDASVPVLGRESGRSQESAEPEPFALGVWTPVEAWRNEGQATPRSTVATLLWAAAGGELGAFGAILEYEDAARAKAKEWFERLPAATRALYGTPEDLLASVTIKNIAPTAAQVTWMKQADPDTAVVGLLLAAPKSGDSPPASPTQADTAKASTSAPNQNQNRLAVLSLHRNLTGWHVVIPAAAIDRLSNQPRPKNTR